MWKRPSCPASSQSAALPWLPAGMPPPLSTRGGGRDRPLLRWEPPDERSCAAHTLQCMRAPRIGPMFCTLSYYLVQPQTLEIGSRSMDARYTRTCLLTSKPLRCRRESTSKSVPPLPFHLDQCMGRLHGTYTAFVGHATNPRLRREQDRCMLYYRPTRQA